MLYRQKRQCNENIRNCRGKRWWFYQLAVGTVWGFWQGFAGHKVKVLAISRSRRVGERGVGCPHSVVFLAGFCWTESQSSGYFPGLAGGGGGGGGWLWLQMTGA